MANKRWMIFALSTAAFVGWLANTYAQTETIAQSSVLNGPIKYSTLMPLAWSTEGWDVIRKTGIGAEIESVTANEINQEYRTIAFRPAMGNVMCDHAEVTYEDQSMQTIDLAQEEVLHDRQLYAIEFGVDPQHVVGVTLQCGAIGSDTAEITIYGEPT